jgi:creatinine amidohydrolase
VRSGFFPRKPTITIYAMTPNYVALETLTWPECERLGAEGAVGLVVLASLEQHGPHLPLATDSLLGERLAREVAERLSGPVVGVPVVRGGLSTHHLAFPGSVTIPPDAYRALVDAYLEGLARMGIRRIGVFSAHGGNFAFVGELVAAYEGKARLAGYSDLARFFQVMFDAAAACGLRAPETDVHAGGLETSMMLAAFPELVCPFDGVAGYTAAEPGWLERTFSDGVRAVSESGVLGDLTGASAEVGEAVFAALADELAGFFAERLELARTS